MYNRYSFLTEKKTLKVFGTKIWCTKNRSGSNRTPRIPFNLLSKSVHSNKVYQISINHFETFTLKPESLTYKDACTLFVKSNNYNQHLAYILIYTVFKFE